MLQNTCLLAKIGADTAENEGNLPKICQNLLELLHNGRLGGLVVRLLSLRGRGDLRCDLDLRAGARWKEARRCMM